MLIDGGRLWRERLAFDTGVCVGRGVAIFFRVIFGVGVF
jgi:hypothetical protein